MAFHRNKSARWALVLLALSVGAVDRSKFKTCDQAAFCKRNRLMKTGATGPGYAVVEGSVRIDAAAKQVLLRLQNQKYTLQDPLICTVSLLNEQTARVQITEDSAVALHSRWEAATPSADVLVPDTIGPMGSDVQISDGADAVVARFGDSEVRILKSPFSVSAFVAGKEVLKANSLGLFVFEAYRAKDTSPDAPAPCENGAALFDGPQSDKFLSECPTGGCSTFASLGPALSACGGIPDCGGVLKRPDNGDLPFELRKGTRVKDSPSGESAFVRRCAVGCPNLAFEKRDGAAVVGACVAGTDGKCASFDNVAEAQALCAPLGACAGIMAVERDAGQIRYELRSGAVESRSGVGPSYVKVCSASEPQRRVTRLAVSGQNSLHSFRMGSYDRVDDGSDGKPVFKHSEKDFFIYYRAEDGAWAIGPTPNDPNVWLYAKSAAAGPSQMDSAARWKYYDGESSEWVQDPDMRVVADRVEVTGTGSAPPPAPVSAKTQAKFPPSQDGMWEESFGGHTDSKPRGPAAVAMDVTYPGARNVYGLAEHASALSLKSTVGSGAPYSDPYRLYNLDVFEYELDVPMALYGAIPLIVGHSSRGTVAAFWLNSAETFIDVRDGATNDKETHWISESGTIDLFLLLGPTPARVFKQYADLTGYTTMPQKFSLGYHQCRWNYKDEADVKQVDAGFDQHDIPYDTLWLDIEHTDGKKYFTWDKSLFPTPEDMQNKLKAKGRKMVTIIDPHIKRDAGYHVHKDAEAQDLYVHDKGGTKPYEGWCWPGSVSYLDFFNPKTLQYWANKFSFDEYKGSTDILYTWNDMNEPSVFNGPEVTMKKDALHWGGVEHRDVHNLYGMQVAKGTWTGQAKRLSKRPFVLTRSFFAGSQRFGAMWTGDNKAEWGHLRDSVPMLLSMGVSGFTFAGADVGGFFGDPDAELLLRWYQLGAFYPFFRGHGHIDTKRREPWLFGEPWTRRMRDAIRTRYRLLPYVYTLFYEAATEATPVMRPLWTEFPDDESTWTMDDQFMLGDAVLVKPITSAGATTASVYFPKGIWYDWKSYFTFSGQRTATVKAPIEKIPIFIRGGTVLSTKERARRNSALMVNDPYTLTVALDDNRTARGKLFLDDGETVNAPYAVASFAFAEKDGGVAFALSATVDNKGYACDNVVERVVVVGIPEAARSKLTKARLVAPGAADTQLSIVKNDKDGSITVRKPAARVDSEWTIVIE